MTGMFPFYDCNCCPFEGKYKEDNIKLSSPILDANYYRAQCG